MPPRSQRICAALRAIPGGDGPHGIADAYRPRPPCCRPPGSAGHPTRDGWRNHDRINGRRRLEALFTPGELTVHR